MDEKIREILSKKLNKEEEEKVKHEFTKEAALSEFLGAAMMLIFENKNLDEITERLVEFMSHPDAGMGSDLTSRSVAANLLERMGEAPCVSGSKTFCMAWDYLKTAFTKFVHST
jgi:hypothetical protein